MKIAVINGTEKQGVTYRLKEIFLQSFQGADIVEFYLPKDCPAFVWAVQIVLCAEKMLVKIIPI